MQPGGAPDDLRWARLSDRLNRWWVLALLCLVGAVPLLLPEVPPLLDVPGHIGRYAIQIGLEASPELRRWYGFTWTLVPNLGVDLLVEAFGRSFGVERTVKLVTMAIPVLQMAGILLVAKQAHGRVPPTALFALPLAWSYPFHMGFLNFALAVALAMIGFALWLRLADWAPGRRALLFAPIACLLWVAHLYGWAVFCVLAGCDRLVRAVTAEGPAARTPAGLVRIGTSVARDCLPLTLPMLLKLVLPLPASGLGANEGLFDPVAKIAWLVMPMRDRWMGWDIGCALLVLGLIIWALRGRRFSWHPGLALAALVLALAYVAMPQKLLGSGYANMRMAPIMLAVALVAIRPGPAMSAALARGLTLIGIAFLAARTVSTSASLYLYDRTYDRELAALDHVPRGAALLSMVWSPCDQGWVWARNTHLPGLALARRNAFSNDQWLVPGGQLLSIHAPQAAPFVSDPSMRVTPHACDPGVLALDKAITHIPASFDHLWIVAPPRFQAVRGWRPVWRSGTSALYQRTGTAQGQH